MNQIIILIVVAILELALVIILWTGAIGKSGSQDRGLCALAGTFVWILFIGTVAYLVETVKASISTAGF